MADLKPREKRLFEEILGMESGYVLDFTNNSFSRFVEETINIDIYEGVGYEEYCSKANKLRQIWQQEPDYVVGELMEELLTFYEDSCAKRDQEIPQYEKKYTQELRLVIERLKSTTTPISLPMKTDDTLKVLLVDIYDSLAKNKPTLVLDRLHTFATKFLRGICIEHGIEIEDTNGKKYALHGLAGKLKKQYEQEEVMSSSFALIAIQNSISLFDRYNDIRNDKSYAHDNKILDDIEAEFVVRAMANVIVFLDNVESRRIQVKKESSPSEEELEIDLPF
ncbi:abortive infection family protein [Planococcus maritimus]|uniref:abortive infection family protein n=1 Tax=Planococcus maritimus TaxID=192421 RepID=UPI0031393B7B